MIFLYVRLVGFRQKITNCRSRLKEDLWGAFTRKKYELMCEKFNLTYEDFESEADDA